MLWFFTRRNQALQIETRYDNNTAEYVGIIRHPGGQEEVRRFNEAGAYGAWLGAFEASLQKDKWRRKGVRILPDGWPDRRLV
jgi:hypothetical protein